MGRACVLGMVLLLAGLVGCRKGGDGDVFAVIVGAPDVTAVDLSHIGGSLVMDVFGSGTPFTFGQKYPIKPGPGSIAWNSVSGGINIKNISIDAESGTTDPLRPTQGKPGADKDYEFYFSGNTMTVSNSAELPPGAVVPDETPKP